MAFLDQYPVLESQNLDDLRVKLSDLLAPHALHLLRRDSEVDTQVYAAQVGRVGLVHTRFGDGVDLAINTLEHEPQNVLMLNFPLQGVAEIEQYGDAWEISAKRGYICDGRHPFDGKYRNFANLLLAVPLDVLREHARGLAGDTPPMDDIRMAPTIDLAALAGRRLAAAVHYVAGQMNLAPAPDFSPILAANMENLLLSHLLMLQPNSYQEFLENAQRGRPLPYHVKRARDFIDAHAEGGVAIADLTRAAGCSYRTLQTNFMSVFGVSPMTYLRQVRLDRVRDALRDAGPTQSVSAIAAKWGFSHHGHFAREYRRRFGVLPSETLRFGK